MVKNIFFDFDGVILDSMKVRDFGFIEILSPYDINGNLEEFIKYHRINGGLSRFHKIEYFFNNYLKKKISKEEVLRLASKFSELMKVELIKKQYLISETLDFINQNSNKYKMYIVSGSEEKELKYLCKELGIEDHFKKIKGSPIPKNQLVRTLIYEENIVPEESILIGDSINDYEAAEINGIDFYGFNNKELEKKSRQYIYSFKNFNI